MEDPNLDPTVALAALDLEIGLIEETRQKMVAGTGRWVGNEESSPEGTAFVLKELAAEKERYEEERRALLEKIEPRRAPTAAAGGPGMVLRRAFDVVAPSVNFPRDDGVPFLLFGHDAYVCDVAGSAFFPFLMSPKSSADRTARTTPGSNLAGSPIHTLFNMWKGLADQCCSRRVFALQGRRSAAGSHFHPVF